MVKWSNRSWRHGKQQYDGTANAASASVSPASCGPVTLSYSQNGTPVSAPTSAGSYPVQASLGNPDCTIASGGTGTLDITPAPAMATQRRTIMPPSP